MKVHRKSGTKMLVRKQYFLLFKNSQCHYFYCLNFTDFFTPQNKSVLSRKTVFSDKPKMAFGELKRSLANVATPLKSAIEKTEVKTQFQHFTPKLEPKSTIKVEIPIPTAEPPKPDRGVIDYSKSEIEVWNQKLLLMLSDEQFDKIFVNPPNDVPPPASPEPEELYCPPSPPVPDFDFESIWDCSLSVSNNDGDDTLPDVNFSMFGDESTDMNDDDDYNLSNVNLRRLFLMEDCDVNGVEV